MNSVPKGFVFITPVWGESHMNTFLEIGLSSLLSKNNLPSIERLSHSNYLFFTSKEDLKKLKSNVLFQRLQKLMKVDIELINPETSNPHGIMSQCHRVGLQRAYQEGLGSVLIPPDCVWADGSMKNMEQIVSSRKVSVIHITGLRLIKETVVPVLKTYFDTDKLLSLSSQPLVKIALSHLHPITESHFFEGEGGLMPANLFWNVGTEGILAHCFHLHPLYVAPNERNHLFKITVDDDLTLHGQDKNDYIVSDSDEILAFEVSSLTHHVLAAYRKGSIEDIALWAQTGTNVTHRQLIKTPIKIHANQINKKEWKQVECSARSAVDDILEKIKDPKYTRISLKEKPFIKFLLLFVYKTFYVLDQKIKKNSLQVRLREKFYKSVEKENIPFEGKKILFIDGDLIGAYLPLKSYEDHDDVTFMRKEHLLALNGILKSESKNIDFSDSYDQIILRLSNTANLSSQEALLIDKLLKKDGICLITFSHPYSEGKLKNFIPDNYIIKKEIIYNSLFHIFCYNMFGKFYDVKKLYEKYVPSKKEVAAPQKRFFLTVLVRKNYPLKILIKLLNLFFNIFICPIVVGLAGVICAINNRSSFKSDGAIWFQKGDMLTQESHH